MTKNNDYQYVVIVKLAAGTNHYGPFKLWARAKHWAENNWCDFEIVVLYGTD